ncbi:MAG: zf-HC2 domain-containing protein [Pirellulales bacterium]
MSTETNQSDFDRELLSAYVDGELTGAERAAVEAHLASDPAARRQVEEFRRLSGLIQNLPQPSLPADFSARVIARAEQARPAAVVEPLRPSPTIGRTWRGWVWAGAALAAALLLAVMLPNREPELANRGIATSSPAVKEQPEMRAPLGSASSPLERSDSGSSAEQSPRSGGRAEESPLSQEQLSVPETLLTDGDPLSDRAFASGADESPLLIVRVSMSSAALQGRALDQVLAQNGIDVEETQELASPLDKAEAVEESAAGRSAAVQAYVDAASAGVAGEAAEFEGAFAQPREVVLVDAPLEQIAASLASIEGDAENFVALEIEQGSPLSKQRSSIVNDQVDQLRRFNRAAVADRYGAARDSDVSGPGSSEKGLASEERSLEEPPKLAAAEPAGRKSSQAAEVSPPPPADAAPAFAPATPRQATDPRVPESQMQHAARGRAYRYLSADGMKLKLESLARRRGQLPEDLAESELGVRGGSAADPRVRVLFVLEETPPAAAIKAAEPVKPPR